MLQAHIASNRSRVSGFTLVELLVVIGIIALLISMLVPALNRARAAGRTITCASNVRQIGLVFRLYATDNRDSLPPGQYDHGGAEGNWTWTDYLDRYLGARLSQAQKAAEGGISVQKLVPPVMRCPSDA